MFHTWSGGIGNFGLKLFPPTAPDVPRGIDLSSFICHFFGTIATRFGNFEMDGGASSFDDKRAAGTLSPATGERLVRLLIRHQDELFRYIFSLLPHREDARDALQETCVALYRKFA